MRLRKKMEITPRGGGRPGISGLPWVFALFCLTPEQASAGLAPCAIQCGTASSAAVLCAAERGHREKQIEAKVRAVQRLF